MTTQAKLVAVGLVASAILLAGWLQGGGDASDERLLGAQAQAAELAPPAKAEDTLVPELETAKRTVVGDLPEIAAPLTSKRSLLARVLERQAHG